VGSGRGRGRATGGAIGRRRIALANGRHRRSLERRVAGKLRDVWGKWREDRRQYQIERALYKMNGGATGPLASQQRGFDSHLAAGDGVTRVEAPKGKAPDPPAG
jgi:hypothetical protein